MKVHNLSDHNSLMNSFLKEIRSIGIQNDPLRFRRNMERIGEIMSYEISKSFDFKDEIVTTPLADATVNVFQDKVVLATVFRAGLPFHQGFLNYLDRAENAFVSAFRKYKNETDFEILIDYIATPSIEGKTVIIADPMLASGSSMEMAIAALLQYGTPAQIHVASVIASKQGVKYVKEHFPENTTIWCAAIDPELNEHSYIVPGLGDAGDLAFGEKL